MVDATLAAALHDDRGALLPLLPHLLGEGASLLATGASRELSEAPVAWQTAVVMCAVRCLPCSAPAACWPGTLLPHTTGPGCWAACMPLRVHSVCEPWAAALCSREGGGNTPWQVLDVWSRGAVKVICM